MKARAGLVPALLEAGVELDSHESDLYVRDSPAARAVLEAFGYRPGAWGCQSFVSNIGPRVRWFDVPFMGSDLKGGRDGKS